MPLGIGSELCVFTPCDAPLCGMPLRSDPIGEVWLLGIVMPLGIGSELCVFMPCADPVRGMLLGSVDIDVPGARPLFRITMPFGIGSELCVLTPCADPVCGEVVGPAADAALGGCDWAQPLMARATPPVNASRDSI